MKCKTCSHPQRQAIDLALLNDTHTFEALSQHYGLSISTLFRHKKHLVEKMHRARQRFRDSQQQGCLLKLNAIFDHVQRAVQTAEAEGKLDQVIRGSHVSGRLIDRISALEVPLGLDTVYRLISSPQWVSQDSLLPTDPNIITGIHQSLAETALFPCPELILEPAADKEEDDDDYYDEDDDGDDDGEDWEEDDAAAAEEENNAAASLSPATRPQLRELIANLISAAGLALGNKCPRPPEESPLPDPSSLFPGASPPPTASPPLKPPRK